MEMTNESLCSLLKACCEKKGLKVCDHKHGVIARMADGTELFVYTTPRNFFAVNRPHMVFGLIKRNGRLKYMFYQHARFIYEKLKEQSEV